MPPALPLVLADVSSDTGFLSFLTALAAALVAGTLWWLLRRRSAALALGVVLLGALVVGSAYFPLPRADFHHQVTGFVEGEARIPVSAGPDTPLRLSSGEGRLVRDGNGTSLLLSCPTRCPFSLGDDPAWGAGRDATLRVMDGDLTVDLEGGPLVVRDVYSHCQRVPLALRVMGGGDPCGECSRAEYVAGAGNAGRLRLTTGPVAVC